VNEYLLTLTNTLRQFNRMCRREEAHHSRPFHASDALRTSAHPIRSAPYGIIRAHLMALKIKPPCNRAPVEPWVRPEPQKTVPPFFARYLQPCSAKNTLPIMFQYRRYLIINSAKNKHIFSKYFVQNITPRLDF
jgi:hypothetical protein